MILKNLTRTAKPGAQVSLVSYVLRYATNPEKQVDKEKHFVLTHNLRGNTIDEYARQYVANEANRIHKSSRQTAIHHTILSFNPEDSKIITDDILRAIAKQFIRLRGEDNLYLFAKHENTESLHMHCCVSGSTIAGKSSRLSNKDFASIKKELDLFQQTNFPQLSSLPRHGLAKQIAIGNVEHAFENTSYTLSYTETHHQIIEVSIESPVFEEQVKKPAPSNRPSPYFKPGELSAGKFSPETIYKLSRTGFNEKIQSEIHEAKNREATELKELEAIRIRSNELDRGIEHTRQLEDCSELQLQEMDNSEDEEWPFEYETDIENEN